MPVTYGSDYAEHHNYILWNTAEYNISELNNKQENNLIITQSYWMITLTIVISPRLPNDNNH